MKLTNSELQFAELLKVTPLGAQTNSKCPDKYVNGVYPKVLSHGNGGVVWDVDGNEYVDYIAGLGAISLGYCNELVNNWVVEQLQRGVSFSLPTPLEGQVAKKLSSLIPSTEMWKFTKTGSDADSMAIKCARAYTQREKILVVNYHGWHDWYSIVNDKKAGIPLVMGAYVDRARYNKFEDFDCLKSHHYAAVIMEPMVYDTPVPGFLSHVRDLCNKTGTLLIFDEVVTGGRFEGFAAQNYFKVIPDLTVLSKGIANGFPLAAVGGPRSIMGTFERSDFFASTTFGGECVSFAACLATLVEIERTIDATVKRGHDLMQAFRAFMPAECVVKGYPTRSTFDFPTPAHKALFWQECVKQGVMFGYANFLMAMHTPIDMLKTTSAIINAAKTIRDYWRSPESKLEGALPQEPLRMRQ